MVDVLVYGLYGLKWLALGVAWILLVLGIDDLFIDITYWSRRAKRRLGVYRRMSRADETRLYEKDEQPLAVMVPAWQETGVIGEMAALLATTMDYENYQIFVGTYPNDPQTQAEVDAVCQQYGNVHKVVCARPGPTSKADCLNNVINAIQAFEEAAAIQFAGVVLHDAEDVISPMELRLFNYLLPSKDLIQVPVYPFPTRLCNFTAGHYIDEFSEYHGKDVVVREALVGQVPSAGVGTCFSHRSITILLREGDGIAFDTWSLTEDYDIGYRLSNAGLNCVFVRYSVRNPELSPFRETRRGISSQASSVICVREHFPVTLRAVVRQKARWITGIVFQGTQNLGWSRHWALNYFLWRDRRGLIAYPVGLLANVLFLVLLTLWLVSRYRPDAWHFAPILEGAVLQWLLMLNGILLANRLFHRFYFVAIYYGFIQGLLALPRMMWSNVINFLANVRAFKIFLTQGGDRRLPWDKTTHEFPVLEQARRQPIGAVLVQMGAISTAELDAVLEEPRRHRLGRELLARGLINSTQLAQALAQQAQMQWATLDPFKLARSAIDALPRTLALRYSVLPIAKERDTLVIASESAISRIALGAMGRQLKCPVVCRIVPQGRVTIGLRFWYIDRNTLNGESRDVLDYLRHSTDEAEREAVYRHQILLGDLIQELGLISATVFGQALIDFRPTEQSLGDYLIDRGLISHELLAHALKTQRAEQQAALRAVREHHS